MHRRLNHVLVAAVCLAISSFASANTGNIASQKDVPAAEATRPSEKVKKRKKTSTKPTEDSRRTCETILPEVAVSTPVNEVAEKAVAEKKTIKKLPPGSTVVLDTNILMKFPLAMYNYPGLRVVIPKQVIRELDNNNHRDTVAQGTKVNIRTALRELKALSKKNGPWSKSFQEVELGDGAGTVIVFDNRDHLKELGSSKSKIATTAVATLDANHPDDKIIAAAAFYYENRGSKFTGDVALVTGDGVATMSALEVGLNALEHSAEAHYAQDELDGKIYNGRLFVELTEKQYEAIANKPFLARSQIMKMMRQEGLRLFPNQFVVFLKPGDRAIYQAYVKGEGDGLPKDQLLGCFDAKKDQVEMIRAFSNEELAIDLNLEQRMAFFAAVNPRIRRLIMTGKAGSGKTVVSLLAARMQLASAPVTPIIPRSDRYDALVMTKTDDKVGDRDPGFLPGSLEEKLGPVYASYKDALAFVISREKKLAFKHSLEGGESIKGHANVNFDKLAEAFMAAVNEVEIAHFGFFRGRTFRNRMVLFDEAQNLSPGEMKTLVTRIGERAKLIVMGDINQIDANFNDTNNGISHLINLTVNRWNRDLDEGVLSQGSDQSAVVKLVRSRREVLVEWTTQLYDEEE